MAQTTIGGAPVASGVSADLPYADFGIIPGIAQQAQATVPPNPHLSPRPAFSAEQLAHALWYTTRVHLAPLGNALRLK